ncbi:DUF695 domain-containing protein [Microbispora hainanensis]|jgi:hypothetical protein|uniref:DUF695 domain-containing protein n=1 Tax=Microbispora hainanensis TaxID=568844 RepID=A0ABZ1SNR7_9ACTN|nr:MULTISPECIES: DUF695 domain-containing protein [Microbispora]NJP24014.1 DUF695 domain-containing protein [Microbispora sp. CL1-1]TQS15523.1 DUF695 domain-containing protein [Microbispora sp. SCL1-1]
MRLFGRKSESADPAEAIAAFWTWWDEARPQIDAHVEAEDPEALFEMIGPAVTALHPSLVWEIAPGRMAVNALVVSASNDPELRPFAHRWALAAPPADAMWEFYPSRQANPQAADLTVDVGGREFGLDRLVVALRVPPGSPRVDVTAFHPIFPDVDDDTRTEAAFLALDWLLGEDEVARWVGEIVAAEFEPIDALPAIHLPSVVAEVAEEFKEEQWALLEGRTATGGRLTATARYPLRPVDFPLFDQHITVTLPYREADGDGLPAGASLDALGEFEERLNERLAALGSAVLVAHLSADRSRVMHLYADPAAAVPSVVEEVAAGWKEGRAHVDVAEDPSWSAVAHFLT